jgi:hypothetical protein
VSRLASRLSGSRSGSKTVTCAPAELWVRWAVQAGTGLRAPRCPRAAAGHRRSPPRRLTSCRWSGRLSEQVADAAGQGDPADRAGVAEAVARPCAATAVVYSPAVRPGSAHAMRASVSRSSVRIAERVQHDFHLLGELSARQPAVPMQPLKIAIFVAGSDSGRPNRSSSSPDCSSECVWSLDGFGSRFSRCACYDKRHIVCSARIEPALTLRSQLTQPQRRSVSRGQQRPATTQRRAAVIRWLETSL